MKARLIESVAPSEEGTLVVSGLFPYCRVVVIIRDNCYQTTYFLEFHSKVHPRCTFFLLGILYDRVSSSHPAAYRYLLGYYCTYNPRLNLSSNKTKSSSFVAINIYNEKLHSLLYFIFIYYKFSNNCPKKVFKSFFDS